MIHEQKRKNRIKEDKNTRSNRTKAEDKNIRNNRVKLRGSKRGAGIEEEFKRKI